MEELIKALYQLVCQQSDQVNKTLELLTNNNPINLPIIQAAIKPLNYVVPGTNGNKFLDPNKQRQGIIVVNESNDILYVAADPTKCTPDNYTFKVDANSTEFYIPANGSYCGAFNCYPLDPTGRAMITEFSYE